MDVAVEICEMDDDTVFEVLAEETPLEPVRVDTCLLRRWVPFIVVS